MRKRTENEQVILWLLQTASHRVRRIELLRVAPEEVYQGLLKRGEIAEYAVSKKVYVTLTLQAQEWWRQN